ncbi:MAG: hypothetical protein K6F71_05905 [Ruminococcus sp.]|uniref:hypothetical protein n=1 Tax=Ruminococcus sp. TaxID=41978 RepID=UPI0025D1A5AD|nr:hypothetical protein [Ruminococcus sp.]MCR5540342.1 hypothetical protein [Ruminococcus sp.]
MAFQFCQGVSAPAAKDLESGYKYEDGSFTGIISAELMAGLAEGFIDMADEPVFFLLELPRDDSEEYDVYYLDNCTKAVARAIMKRYGELLIQDGLSRFGFGSNKTEEELYFMDYQEFMLYTPKKDKAEKLLKKLGIAKTDAPCSMWNTFTEEQQGSLSAVELEGETVFDIPEALEEVGMYLAEQ